jgi:hypothetical protein
MPGRLLLLTFWTMRLLGTSLLNTPLGAVERGHTEAWGLVTALQVHDTERCEVEFGLTSLAWAGLPVDPGSRTLCRMVGVVSGRGKVCVVGCGKLCQRRSGPDTKTP